MKDGLQHAIRVTTAVAKNYENVAVQRAMLELARELRRQVHHIEQAETKRRTK